MLFSFFGCEKLSDAQKREIERYKNAPRDARLIGQWKFSSEHGVYVADFRSNGSVVYASAVYNDRKEIEYFKNDKDEVYFYTENDNIIQYYVIGRSWLYGPYYDFELYEIKQDSLYRDMGERLTGVRVDVEIRD